MMTTFVRGSIATPCLLFMSEPCNQISLLRPLGRLVLIHLAVLERGDRFDLPRARAVLFCNGLLDQVLHCLDGAFPAALLGALDATLNAVAIGIRQRALGGGDEFLRR